MGELLDRLVSPHGFDGMGSTPESVREAAKRLARLRVKFVKWTNSDDVSPLTQRETQDLFDAAALQAEWIRELFDARGALDKTLREIASYNASELRSWEEDNAADMVEIARKALLVEKQTDVGSDA